MRPTPHGTERFTRICRRLWNVALSVALVLMVAEPQVVLAKSGSASRVFVNAKSAIVMDASSKRVLYAKQADEPMYPASTTKLMTAILLVTHLRPTDPVYVSPAAARQEKVRLGLRTGTTLTADEALHAILMKSANDVAYAVAETVGGSQQGFARMMNLKAGLIGCTHTNFVTPNGLHEDGHKTSAHDVALILAEAIRYPEIVRVMQTPEYRIGRRIIRNGNRFIYLTKPTFGTVIGGKTGFTSRAMYCLALAAKQGNRVTISVVLGAPRKSFMYRETRRLQEFALAGRKVTLV